ncbi:MAG: hypothetical protein WC898_04080 [Candidatus Paceibacterota bacterium]|jgi:hypothetical protein
MSEKIINLLAADMGYGHQRPAHALRHLSGGEVLIVNDYKGIEDWEKDYWVNTQSSYEKISRLKKIPLFGHLVFKVMDAFQKIRPMYPTRDLSRPSVQQLALYSVIKKGLGKNLINQIDNNKSLVTTFFVGAYMAEYHGYSGDIYCVVCDTDASRAWAPLNPQGSRIKYFLPNDKLKERFLMYGMREENLIVTGFPLPKELIGEKKELALLALKRRVSRLDPSGEYRKEYDSLLKSVLPKEEIDLSGPLTIAYAVGGAGAQKEIGGTLLKELAREIKKGNIALNLIAGVREEVRDYFILQTKENGLKIGEGVEIIYAENKDDYFVKFNKTIASSDILWTKPSELSFFCALGLPIIISEPIGSQEDFNREWILSVGAGINALPLEHVEEWLPDLLNSGRLARAAVDGFLNAENIGTYNIEKILKS